jgi:hypothetical protein
MNVLRALKNKVDRHTLEMIYNSFIRPKLEYGDIIYAGAPSNCLQKLNKLEFEALRIITGATWNTSITKLCLEYGKPLLIKRRRSHILREFYKIHNGLSPNYLLSLCEKFKCEKNYSLRNNTTYRLPAKLSTICQKTFFPLAITLWNSIPEKWRNSPSVNSFKAKLLPKPNILSISYYYGKRWPNIHHARIRMGCSGLNSDLCLNLHVRDSPSCRCGWYMEDADHYLNECPIYDVQRKALLDSLKALNLGIINGRINTQLIIFGDPKISLNQMYKIYEAFHKYLIDTKRLA